MSRYLETANELTQSLNSLFSSLTLGKFIKWILVLFVVLFVYEKLISSSFYYDKLERKLQIIEKVRDLNRNDSIINQTINQTLLETLNTLNPPESNYLESINLNRLFPPQSFWIIVLKIFGAAILPVLIIFASRGKENSRDTITGAILFIIVFGVVAIFIPVIYNIWINILGMPFLQLLVLLPFMLKRKKAQTSL